MCHFSRDPKRRKICWNIEQDLTIFQVHFNAEIWTESKTGNGKQRRMLKKDTPIVFDELVLQTAQEDIYIGYIDLLLGIIIQFCHW